MSLDNIVRELVVKIRFAVDSAEVRKVESTINTLANKLNNLGGLSKINQSISNVTSSALKMGLAFGVSTAGLGYFLSEFGNFRKTEIAFETMTGSIERGRDLMKEMESFALETPNTLEEVQTNAAMLLGMGIEADKVRSTMKSLGDVAAGVNRPLSMIAMNFGQVRTRGVLLGTELRDFARQSVPIIEQLAKQMNVSEASIAEMASQHKISFDEVEKAFIAMTSKGGRFYDLALNQAKTWPVMVSNFVIWLRILSREIGEKLTPVAVEYLGIVTEWIKANKELITSKLVEFFRGMLEMLRRIGVFMKDTLPVVISMVESLGGMARILKVVAITMSLAFGLQVANMVGTIIISIGSLIGAMLTLNIAAGFLPLLIGAAVIALALLVDDIMAFKRGDNSITGHIFGDMGAFFHRVDNIKKTISGLVDWIPKTLKTISWLLYGGEGYGSKFLQNTNSAMAGIYNNEQSQGPGVLSSLVNTVISGSGQMDRIQSRMNNSIKNDINITVQGAGDPAAVAGEVRNQLYGAIYSDLMNNTSNMATSPMGGGN